MKKAQVITTLIDEQNKIIADLEKAIKVYRKASDVDEDDTLDPEDFSHQAEAKDMQLRLENKLLREKNALKTLEKHQKQRINEVKIGSLIETEAYYFYIGVATHPVSVDNKKVLGVSEKAPIMTLLKGKKKGDKITVGGKKYTILSID